MRDETNRCTHGEMSEEEKAKCFMEQAVEKAKEAQKSQCGCIICRIATYLFENSETLTIPEISDVGRKLKTMIEVRHNIDAWRQAASMPIMSPDENPRYVEDVYEDLAKFVEEKLQYPHFAKAIRIMATSLREMRLIHEHLENEQATFEGVLQARNEAAERAEREQRANN